MAAHNGWRLAERPFTCLYSNNEGDHYIQPGERYFKSQQNTLRTVRICARCVAERGDEPFGGLLPLAR